MTEGARSISDQRSMSRMLWLTAEVTDGAAPEAPDDGLAEDEEVPESTSWSVSFLAWADTELRGPVLGS
jgi:hypothetical protein